MKGNAEDLLSGCGGNFLLLQRTGRTGTGQHRQGTGIRGTSTGVPAGAKHPASPASTACALNTLHRFSF